VPAASPAGFDVAGLALAITVAGTLKCAPVLNLWRRF
jgi:hypothetical protein